MIQRKPLVHLLAKLGLPPASEAENGSHAMILLKSEPHEGLICSPHLENPDGLSLLKRIRESPELGKMKMMMYFEDEHDYKIVSATRAGMDGYLVIPFQENNLETMLKNIW